MAPHSVKLNNSSSVNCKTVQHVDANISNISNGNPTLDEEQCVRIPVKDTLKTLNFTDDMSKQTFWLNLAPIHTLNNEKARLNTHFEQSPTVECKVESDSGYTDTEVPHTICRIVTALDPKRKVKGDNVHIWDVTPESPLRMKFSLQNVFIFSSEVSKESANDMIHCIEALSDAEIKRYAGCTTAAGIEGILNESLPMTVTFANASSDMEDVLWLPQNSMAYYIVVRSLAASDLSPEDYVSTSQASHTLGQSYITIPKWKTLRNNPGFNSRTAALSKMMSTAFCSMKHSTIAISVHGWVRQEVSPDCQLEYRLCDHDDSMDVSS